ncbi:glycosyltransferase family 2 protein [Streptomyces hyaluromycini]|uniref:glycosyltransferase family 2 protein n=1 Tax=Streptomyces hyaluromycini TaxID=1377993 RepID=UPI000B5C2BA3|nr:glycosyltransferase family A protein [Streptomyces hyaluromycini]
MPVKVSVVVPVYNPGPYIEDCIASVLRQSLPSDEYEVIFVDDGSSDETPARLDAVAAEHPHVHVIHQEPSGWSGKPRNVGIAASKGEFVMFVDNDDFLGDEALERMYNYGVENEADLIIGKMAGKGRPVPVELFRRNHPRATVENAPLMDSLTPHKMLRRSFLDRIGLRFPEGRRRLEDHVFVAEAYLRASNISVLSDYVCYYHLKRDDASNAGFQRFDPVGYFANLREALDVVERYTEPGHRRDLMFRRWLRSEMGERLRGNRFVKLPDDYRRELFDEIHKVIAERMGPSVFVLLEPAHRVVTELAGAGRYEDVLAVAEWEAAIAPSTAAQSVTWDGDALKIEFSAEYAVGGAPKTYPADTSGTEPEGPAATAAEAIARLERGTAARFARARVDLMMRERETHAQFFQPVEITRETLPVEGEPDRVRLVVKATAAVNPATAASGTPLPPGLWDAFVRLTIGGWTREHRLFPVSKDPLPALPVPGVVGGHRVLPYWTVKNNFALDVDQAGKRLGFGEFRPEDFTVAGDRLRAVLPFHVTGDVKAAVRLTGPKPAAEVLEVPATLSPAEGGGAVLDAPLPVRSLQQGGWRLALCLVADAAEPRFFTLPLVVRNSPEGLKVAKPAPKKAKAAAAPRPKARPGVARRLARKLPLPVRRALVRALGRGRKPARQEGK